MEHLKRSLRIPAWLAGSTAALLIAAAVRVAEVRGLAGVVELAQMVVLVASCAYGLVIAERYETHPLAHIYFWPSRKFRKLLFLAGAFRLLLSPDRLPDRSVDIPASNRRCLDGIRRPGLADLYFARPLQLPVA